LLTAALFSAVMAGVTSAHAQVVSGKQPLAVVLCKFKDLPDEPHDVAYYQDMFSEAGAGKKGVFDFWKDVSYGNLDLTGTVVKGWYTADKTGAEYNALDRGSQIDVCASNALPDIDFNKFSGVVVITNFRNLQGPVFGGEGPTTIGGTTYPNLGFMTATIDSDLNISQHETGHTFGLVHSRTVSDNPTQADYGDSYDVMSCAGCYGTSAYSYQGAAGPGLNAVQLANAGWLPAGRVLTFNPSGCTQQTVQMAALNHPEAAGPLEARIPAAVPINKTLTSTTSDYYSIELRSKSGWDSGIPDDTFLVHMRGQDGYSYWVDSAGALTAGTEFVDAARNTYVGVNSIERTPASNGVITLSSCKIKTNLVYSGGTSDTYHEKVFLGANLTVDPSGAPIAGVPVRMTFGSRQCAGTTDRTGHIDCKMQLSDPPGTYTVTASYAGSDAYEPQTATTSYTINKRATSLQYSGASNAINGSATTLKFVLSEDNGSPIRDRKVDLTLGSGASAQTCDAISGIDGDVQCTLPRVLQPAGPTSVQAAFAGDDFYLPATGSATIDVAKGQTVLRYAGPINIANDYPATFRATLTQQDGAVPLGNRQVSFTLGSGSSAQVCTGTADGNGNAECTIANVAQPANASTVGVQVAFAGDESFLPSNASASAVLLNYSGRSYGLSTKIAVLPPVVATDTGEVSTASKSTTLKSSASVSNPLVSISSLNASVTTGGGKSTGQSKAGSVTIGIAGLPVIRATTVQAASESVCHVDGPTASASGGVSIGSLTIGGILRSTATVAPNTVIRLGLATITLNEQGSVPGSSAGMFVNAIHVSVPGIADVVVLSARSNIHNCP